MPKYPKNKKGKQPLRPRRGPDGRWIPPPPDPEPPDDQSADQSVRQTAPIDEGPVTARGLVIREPSPRRPTLVQTESPQSGEHSVRSVSGNGREMVLLRRSPSVIADTAETREKRLKRQPVTMEEVTDEDGGRLGGSCLPVAQSTTSLIGQTLNRSSGTLSLGIPLLKLRLRALFMRKLISIP